YRQKDSDVTIEFLSDDIIKVNYPQGVSSVTCGQEAVFYQGQVCLGGGVIDDVFKGSDSLEKRIEEYAKR
ncbi:MAG: aminomethyltransferase beta-barrel domain-containing protein, partial [Erysipelotrichaceae bacterium]